MPPGHLLLLAAATALRVTDRVEVAHHTNFLQIEAVEERHKLGVEAVEVLTKSGAEVLKKWRSSGVEVVRSSRGAKEVVVGVVWRGRSKVVGCRLEVPGKGEVVVEEEEVVGAEQGEEVGWAQVWDGGEGSCGVLLEELPLGMVTLTLTLDTIGLYGQQMLDTVITQVHMEDNLLTNIIDPTANNIPIHYNITIDPDLLSTSTAAEFRGKTEVEMRVGEGGTGRRVELHMDGLEVEAVRVWGRRVDYTRIATDTHLQYQDMEELRVVAVTLDPQRTLVGFDLEEGPRFWENDLLYLDIKYRVRTEVEEHRGFGLYKVPCRQGGAKLCWFSQFEATGARFAFPCRDEPDMKATFRVAVGRTEGWAALANMPLEITEARADRPGWVWDVFTTSVVMPTYLVALAIHDYSVVRGRAGVAVWADREAVVAGQANYSATLAPRVLQFFSETFGLNYSLPKMDMIAVPGGQGVQHLPREAGGHGELGAGALRPAEPAGGPRGPGRGGGGHRPDGPPLPRDGRGGPRDGPPVVRQPGDPAVVGGGVDAGGAGLLLLLPRPGRPGAHQPRVGPRARHQDPDGDEGGRGGQEQAHGGQGDL